MSQGEILKRGVAYVAVGASLVAALSMAMKLKYAIRTNETVAALGPEVSKGIGMLGSFGAYVALLAICALVVYPVLKLKTKAEIYEPKRKPILSQQTPVPR